MYATVQKMNKNLYLVIGVVALLLLGGGAYFMMTKSSTSQPATTAPAPATSSSQPATALKSLKDLFLSGVAQKCTFTDKTENMESDGVTYISGGKMRGDFNSKVEGKMMTSHMIVDGKTSYIWSDDQTNGVKMSFDPKTFETESASNTTSNASVQKEETVDVNKELDYKCSSWGVDNSLFTPPAKVKFIDYSAMLTPSAGKTGTGVNPGCSACDSLEGDAQTQCRTALKCS